MAKAKKFTPVQISPKIMTADQVKRWLGNLPDSEVMRSILRAEIQDIRAGDPREERTMRGLWYDIVKPLLSQAGILNNKTSGGKDIPWAGNLSKYLAELVRAGETSYEELGIVDGSRQRQPAQALATQLIDVQMVGAHFPWIILFTEKDTIWGVLESLADLYGVSAISGGGEPSNACTENTVREIIRSDTFQENQPEDLIILSLTDYDPFGYKIAQAQFDQVLEAAGGVTPKELGQLKHVRHTRLGLTPDQLTPAQRQAKSYEPKDTGLAEWFAKYGGVDGEPLGLELDALPLSQLRRMFAEGIERVIDLEKRRQDLREAFIDLLACELLLPEFESKRQAMLQAVKSNGLWSQITSAPIPDDLFKAAAVSGAGWIAPVQTKTLFKDYQEQVKQVMGQVESGSK